MTYTAAKTTADAEADTLPWTVGNDEHAAEAKNKLHIWPLDEYNAATLNEVHPRGYKGPLSDGKPHDEYDLIAIGAGAGGLVTSRQVRNEK